MGRAEKVFAMLGQKRLGLAAVLAMGTALAGCEREIILEGERLDARTPLAALQAADGEEAAPLVAVPANEARAIALPGQTANADWTHRGGSARHSGPNGSLSAAPQRVWTVNIGTGNSRRNRVTAAPVVASGRVFAMDARAQVTAVSTGGGLLWQANLAADFDKNASEVSGGGLAASAGRLFATTAFGELVALDASSGTILWRQRFDAPVIGAPTVEGGAVYATARDGTALAVSAENGKILWTGPGTRTTSGMVSAGSPSVGDGIVVVPYATGEIAGFQSSDGAKTWGAALAGQRVGRAYAAGISDLTGDPVLSGGTVYVGSAAGRTAAIDAKTGERLWSVSEGAMNPPLVVGGSVFVVNDEAKLVRLDAGSGALIWSVQMPYFKADKPKKFKAITAHYGPVMAGGRLAIVSSDGGLRLFSATDGTLVGTAEIPGGAASPAALAAGLLFVVSGDGQLHAFR
jgi:outer membrane protein assembly factor BamB